MKPSEKLKEYRQSIFFGMSKCDECGAEKNRPCVNDDDHPMLHPCEGSTTRKMTLGIYSLHHGNRMHYCIKKRINGRDLKFFESTNRESAQIELEKIKKLVMAHGFQLAFEIYKEVKKHVKTKHTNQEGKI